MASNSGGGRADWAAWRNMSKTSGGAPAVHPAEQVEALGEVQRRDQVAEVGAHVGGRHAAADLKGDRLQIGVTHRQVQRGHHRALLEAQVGEVAGLEVGEGEVEPEQQRLALRWSGRSDAVSRRLQRRQLEVGLVVGSFELVAQIGGVAPDQGVAELVLVGVVAVEHEGHVVPLVEQGAHGVLVTGVGAPRPCGDPGHGEAHRLVDLPVQVPRGGRRAHARSVDARCSERVQDCAGGPVQRRI